MKIRYPNPGEVIHIKQAYIDSPYWATQKYISPSNRNGYSIMECLTCHATECTDKQFRDNQYGFPTTYERIRDWKRVHRHKES